MAAIEEELDRLPTRLAIVAGPIVDVHSDEAIRALRVVLQAAGVADGVVERLLPVVEAGLTQMVEGAAQLDEHLKVEPAPGHTPGTIAIKFESKGEKGLFCGDILHHALQVYHPEWNSFACAEAVGARKSRLEALQHCAGSGARLMPCHFGAPFTCHIDHKGSGFVPRFDAQY